MALTGCGWLLLSGEQQGCLHPPTHTQQPSTWSTLPRAWGGGWDTEREGVSQEPRGQRSPGGTDTKTSTWGSPTRQGQGELGKAEGQHLAWGEASLATPRPEDRRLACHLPSHSFS